MTYAVIYDRWDSSESDWLDDMYEAFASPDEAARMFRDMAAGMEAEIRNPRVVLILEPIAPPDGAAWATL